MHNRKHPNKISSFKGALEEVRRLKKFTKEDYTAYKHLKYLGCYYGEQIMKENYEIMKEKLKQKNIQCIKLTHFSPTSGHLHLADKIVADARCLLELSLYLSCFFE